MDEQEIQQRLGDMGKACFVTHFELFAQAGNGVITQADAADALCQATHYTLMSCKTRVAEAVAIIGAGAVHAACIQIENSPRVPQEIREGAHLIRVNWP